MKMKRGSIVVVDDNKNVLSALRILFSNYFEEVYLLPSPNTLISTIREKNPDVALLDMNFSAGINTGNEGLFWLSEIKKVDPHMPVVLFTAYADIELAVTALKQGANDFVVKPWDNARLIATLQSALALRESRKEVKRLQDKQSVLNTQLLSQEGICWGESLVMKELLDKIEKVAVTDANILITGENGTGKGLIADAIHRVSLRKNETLVTVDMGAITPSLFESELFGHMKGSFTDAYSDRAGKFEAADGGTLFLDEIGNLDITLQSKLLTALQSRQIVRVGSNKPIEVDIRLISATNSDLHKEVAEERFREDLFYRINTIQLEAPSLRDRVEDIPILANFFLDRLKSKYGKPTLKIDDEAVDKLQNYSWPGNVRELEHAVEKAVILSDGKVLKPSDFYMRAIEGKEAVFDSMTIDEMESKMVERAMKRHDNNVSAAAEELGITRPTLYSKIKKYDL